MGDSIIPGTQKIYVRTWGCSHNNSDGEYMAGQLAAYGYKITGTVMILSLVTTVHGYVHVWGWLTVVKKRKVKW